MKKVLVFGTFDGLHPGHLNFFEQAKKRGDYLIVVVARDATVEKVKNHKPVFSEKERLKMVEGCELVDEARLGYGEDPYEVVREIKPDVICLGYDQESFTKDLPKEIKKSGLKTKIFRMKPYHPEKYHSTILRP